MIVVAGWIQVEPEERSAYLASSRAAVEAAREAAGCIDFAVSADLVDDGRVNVFEQWETIEDVERFRGSGPSDDQQALILEAQVVQHTVADSTPLT